MIKIGKLRLNFK